MSIEELIKFLKELKEKSEDSEEFEIEGAMVLKPGALEDLMNGDLDDVDEEDTLLKQQSKVIRDFLNKAKEEKEKKCCKCNEKSNVNHPDHYKAGDYECMDVMRKVYGDDLVIDFCIGNAFKYLFRCAKKGKHEDLLKARWYLNKYKEIATGEADDNQK